MKGEYRWSAGVSGRCQRRRGDQGVDALDVDHVILRAGRTKMAVEAGGQVVIAGARIGGPAQDAIPVNIVRPGQITGGIGGQHRHLHPRCGQSPGYLVNVGLDTAHERQCPGSNHGDPQCAGLCAHCDPFRQWCHRREIDAMRYPAVVYARPTTIATAVDSPAASPPSARRRFRRTPIGSVTVE